ncbi:MAG: hypothetical protein JWM85_124 [Acidimicrobiaceae bacterium]|nr:hypothetical protein [Acidimicrobiaceae bacterium]
MTDATNPRVAKAQEFLGRLVDQQAERATALLSPVVEYRLQGRYPLAGDFCGPAQATGHLAKLFSEIDGTLDLLKWEDWMLGGQHVAALLVIGMQRHGRRLDAEVLILLGFTVDDQISAVDVFFKDEQQAERFFA